MAYISLDKSIRTCKVDTGWANKIQSDRFENPDLMMCPVWNGRDTTGRQVCVDSFYTKSSGCSSAEDRIMVENSLRPSYFEYINLNAAGLSLEGGYNENTPTNIYNMARGNIPNWKSQLNLNKVTGNFGLDFNASIENNCAKYPYERGMSQGSVMNRNLQYVNENFQSYSNKRRSGF